MARNGDSQGFKVTPEQLSAISGTAGRRIQIIKRKMAAMQDKVKKTSSYWQGVAADAHRKAFLDNQGDIDELLERARLHIEDLEKMAGVYQEEENKIQQIINELPKDIIT